MSKEKLNQIESMLSQLITSVGTIMTEQTAVRKDIINIKDEQKAMRDENQVRHHEIMRRLGRLEADQTYTWKKTVENERDINMLKSQAN